MAHDSVLQQLLGTVGADRGDGSEGGLTSAGLMECAHLIDVRREEVLLTLYANVAERMAQACEEEETEEASASAAPCHLQCAALEADLAFSTALAQLQSEQHAALAAEDAGVAQLAALAAQHAAVLAAMQETIATAASVRVAAELHQRLADFDAAVAGGSYTEAAWTALELQKAVQAVPDSQDTAAAVEARVEPLQQQLLANVFRLFAIDPASRMPVLIPLEESSGQPAADNTGTSEAAAAALAETWKALEVFGLLPQALQQLASYFLQHSVQPILASEHDPSLVSDSPAGSIASSNLSRATTMGGGRGSSGASVERLLYKALRALAETVLGGREELVEQLGAVLWPQLAAGYITAKLKPMQPQSDAEVELYSRRSALGGKLEQKAVKLRLLRGDKEGPITRYIQHTLNRFLNLRRNRFIATARDLLQSPAAQEAVTVGVPCRLTMSGTPKGASRSLFGSTAGSTAGTAAGTAAGPAAGSGGGTAGLNGEDPLLACGEYSISKAAQGAVNLMREALTEAVRSGNTALAQAMCGAVVDVAAMVVALPAPAAAAAGAAAAGKPPHPAVAAEHQPAVPAELLLPYPASLRHNDCHYVYQALCNLPYQFAPRLQQLVHRNLNFINPATRVRHAGQDALQAMVLAQEEELLGVVEDFRRFAGLDGSGQAGIRCRKAVQQLLHAFRRLGGVLRGVLAPGVLVEVAASLIQSVCGQITEDIMQLPDISISESEQIPVILEPLTAGICDAVLPQPAAAGRERQTTAAGAVGGVGLEELSAALAERTPAVMKLKELCELLDIRMVEIRHRWQEGRLQALGFSAEEVAHLVRALFEDTDLRRDFLHLLEAQAQEGE